MGADERGPCADTFVLPVVSLLLGGQAGVSLVLSPEDPILELDLTVRADGAAFGRKLLRLGAGRPVAFSAHVIAHAPCWRPALQFATTRFAPYYEPWVEHAARFEGLGSYTWNQVRCAYL
jgi:hypothetical protein